MVGQSVVHKNSIVTGDCFDWLDKVPANSIDMCYIDPPFFSGKHYEIVWGNSWETRSFGDSHSGGIKYYSEWMALRLKKIHRVLKPTGTIFLHCDKHASHYLRLKLDEIFGEKNFVNEIIWHYRRWTGKAKKFQQLHDNIFWYSKGDSYTFNQLFTDYTNGSKHRKKNYHTRIKGNDIYETSINPRGVNQNDVWVDINVLNSQAKERCGYKTQKPLELLKRIIKCSTNKGNIILDCFTGGGTTAVAAMELGRKFIVGDVSPVAVKVTAARLKERKGFSDFEILNYPRTKQGWLDMDGHEFAEKICMLHGWECNEKKSGDGGIDGWANKGKVPIQIKNHSKAIGINHLKNFVASMGKASDGIFVAWKYTTQCYDFLIDAEKIFKKKIQLLTVEELLGNGIIISSDEFMRIQQYYKERKCPLPEMAV